MKTLKDHLEKVSVTFSVLSGLVFSLRSVRPVLAADKLLFWIREYNRH